jgi:hypothetical protein
MSNSVRAYIMTTGAVFGLITVAHVARVFAEGLSGPAEPWFALTSVAGAVLCLWALGLLRRAKRP